MIGKRTRRLWLVRVVAITIGLLPFIAMELLARAFLPSPQRNYEPFVDASNLQPLFVSDEAGRLSIPDARLNLFQPVEFSRQKTPNEFRIFALGGSSTQGEPFATETAFPKWVELYLQAACPDKTIRTINCGALSYASYRVRSILEEVLLYEPDLILVYTGHNEYLERRELLITPNSQPIAWLANQIRSVQLLQSLWQEPRAATKRTKKSLTVLRKEVDALLDYQGGLESYQRSANWMAGVPQQFEWNIQSMIESVRKKGVPILFVLPVSNLKDCPPFKSQLPRNLDEIKRNEFAELTISVRDESSWSAREPMIEEMLKIDPQNANALYLAGLMEIQKGNTHSAYQYLADARDHDVCPLRSTSSLVTILKQQTKKHNIPVVDAQMLCDEESSHAIAGNELLVDHVHPTVDGHRRIGVRVAEEILQAGWLRTNQPAEETNAKFETVALMHLSRLNPAYYERAKQRLRGLMLWTQGRAKKIRAETKPETASDL